MRTPSLADMLRIVPWLLIFGAIAVFTYVGSPAGQQQLNSLRPAAVRAGRLLGLTLGPTPWTPDVRVPPPKGLQTFWDLQLPIRGAYRVSSGYGWRVHPVYRTRKFHNGIDLAVPVGTAVHAPHSGTVKTVSYNGRSGNFITIDHGQGVRTTYCHLDQSMASAGDTVELGELIAHSGNTGASTGPHLHWIVKVNGKSMDPAVLLEATAEAETPKSLLDDDVDKVE